MLKNKIKILTILIIIFLLPQTAYADTFQDGIRAYNQQDYFTAEKCFKRALIYSPDNYFIRYYLAITLVKNNKNEEAKIQYLTIVKTAPNTDAAYKSMQGLNLLANRNQQESDRVVLDISNHNTALVVNNVLINNQAQANFILDSGATYTVISTALAAKLGISTAYAQKVTVMTANGQISAAKAVLDSVKVNGLTARNVEVTIFDIPTTQNTSGLLGLSFINKFKVTIDRKNGKLILEKN